MKPPNEPSEKDKSAAEDFMGEHPPHPRIGERQRGVIQAALAQAFADVRTEGREDALRGTMDAQLNAHGHGQEGAIRDANAGVIDDMLQPLILRVRAEGMKAGLEKAVETITATFGSGAALTISAIRAETARLEQK